MRRAVFALILLAGCSPPRPWPRAPPSRRTRRATAAASSTSCASRSARASDGQLRGELTMEKAWTTADLRAGGGPSGSICLQLWVVRVPGDDPPDYLVCATPARGRRAARARAARPLQRAPAAGRRGHRDAPHGAHGLPPLRPARRRSARPRSALRARPSPGPRSARDRSVAGTPRPTHPAREI